MLVSTAASFDYSIAVLATSALSRYRRQVIAPPSAACECAALLCAHDCMILHPSALPHSGDMDEPREPPQHQQLARLGCSLRITEGSPPQTRFSNLSCPCTSTSCVPLWDSIQLLVSVVPVPHACFQMPVVSYFCKHDMPLRFV